MNTKSNNMPSYKYMGQVIEINLSNRYGYDGYSVECKYKFDKQKEKYLLSMWLKREGFCDTLPIDSQEIDTQYISGTRDIIIHNICRLVEQACINKLFDKYVERFEYTCKCFDIGNAAIENERLSSQ